MRKRVNATTERLFSEPLITVAKSCWSVPGRRCRIADAESVAAKSKVHTVRDRPPRRHWRTRTPRCRSAPVKRACCHASPGGNQPDPAAWRVNRVVRPARGDPLSLGRRRSGFVRRTAPVFLSVCRICRVGCSAYSGIPLTHRDYAQSAPTAQYVTLKNRRRAGLGKPSGAVFGTPVPRYVANQQRLSVQKRIGSGMQVDMPVALVENGTSVKQQRVVHGEFTRLVN